MTVLISDPTTVFLNSFLEHTYRLAGRKCTFIVKPQYKLVVYSSHTSFIYKNGEIGPEPCMSRSEEGAMRSLQRRVEAYQL